MPETSVTEPLATKKRTMRTREESALLLGVAGQLLPSMSEAEIARRLELPRTTLRYWLQRKRELPGSQVVVDFFEHPDGIAFLHRLLTTLHLVMNYQSTGLRGIIQVIELSGLSYFVANSLGTQHAIAHQIEQELLQFGEQQRQQTIERSQNDPPRLITVLEDETFHPEICLVTMDAVSRFILVEQYAENRNSETWNSVVDEAISGLGLKVIQSTSDEAKGIIAHATGHYQAHHSPDLFHLLHEIARGLFRRLAQRRREMMARLEQAQTNLNLWQQRVDMQHQAPRRCGRPANHQSNLEEARERCNRAQVALEQLKADYQQAKAELNGISHDYHLVSLTDGTLTLPEVAITSIRERMARLKKWVTIYSLGDKALASLEKAERLLPALQQTLEFVQRMTQSLLAELNLSAEVETAVRQHLIPALYIQKAAAKVSKAEQRHAITALSERLLQPIRQPEHPIMQLGYEQQQRLEAVASQCADLFQRSSSAVEGRNGHLALWHHRLHRLSDSKLKALTIVHNYHSAQPANTTPAQRLFRMPHDNLFEHLLDHVDILRRPARKRTKPQATPLLAAAA